MDYIFDVMNQDRLVAHVDTTKDPMVIKYWEKPGIQPFMGGPINVKRIESFLATRVFDRERPDARELLDLLEIEEYDPYEIVKKTHGMLIQDFTWIRFPNERIEWNDIAIRK